MLVIERVYNFTCMKNILIKVDNLSKDYKQGQATIKALQPISFELGEGQSLAILGPSGSGKTTLLELLAGFIEPTTGSVTIDGVEIFKSSDSSLSKFRNKTMGFIFQHNHLQDYLTAKDNILVPTLAYSIVGDADGIINKVGLTERANLYPAQLSGGEQQRIAIARALINNPKIIFADEPTAKLDKENADKVLEIFKSIQASGVSVVIITHDPVVANMFDNQIILEHGVTKSIKIN
jgi:ABC-type lipoprotein export system ATPase subunit